MATYPNGKIPTSALKALSVGGHLRSDAADSFERWRAQAAKDKKVFTITSSADAYRKFEIQERIFFQRFVRQASGGGYYGDVRIYKGVRYVRIKGYASAATPGKSNHGLGIAIDVRNAGAFGGTYHKWLSATGPSRGWDNREGRAVNEPWHWVYNPANDKHKGSSTKPPAANAKISEDGWFGSGTIRRAQQVAKTPADGKVSNQPLVNKQPGLKTGWEWVSRTPKVGSTLIAKLQRDLAAKGLYKGKIDGWAGPQFWTAFQKAQGTLVDGKISGPSNAVKQFQRNLNNGKLWTK